MRASDTALGLIGTWPTSGPKCTGGRSLEPQIAHPQLQNRLVARFDTGESDTHSFSMSGDHMAEGHDFRASMNDGHPDLRPGIRGSWGRHKTAMHAQIAGARRHLPFRRHVGDHNGCYKSLT